MNAMPPLQELISSEQIEKRIKEVAALIDQHYKGEELVLVAVMKGALCLAADLLRALTIPVTFEWLQASSYGQRGTVRGELSLIGLENLDVGSKQVLVVDDIFDSGHTLTFILSKLQEKKPRSLKSLVLLLKQVARTGCYQPDYVLFPIADQFVVGYGLDFKEHYRGLPGVYRLVSEST